MGSAYTPGLVVTGDTTITRTRRLPIAGDVLVGKGDAVQFDQVVARANLPGDIETVRAADILNIDPDEVPEALNIKEGDSVEEGQIIAEIRFFFNLFSAQAEASTTGTVEFISDVTGHVGIRKPPVPVDVNAYISGKVADVLEGTGVIIETRGALVQGIFGVGGEKQGVLKVIAQPGDTLTVGALPEDCSGLVLAGGCNVPADVLREAGKRGAVGVVTGSIGDADLREYLGYDLGVAITGHEDVPVTLIVTEGFGDLHMAQRTWDVLSELEGKHASLNGATQIRAGAMRPEVIVPLESEEVSGDDSEHSHELSVDTAIRIIRVPYFGKLAKVSELPPEPVTIESGATVRVLKAKLDSGEEVLVPRANVEIIDA